MMMMTSHSGIYSLNKDVLHHILEFHGEKAYATLGLVNKEFHKLFDDDDDDDDETTTNTITKTTTKKKETFIGFISPQIMTELREEYLLLFGASTMLRMSRAISMSIIKYRNMGLLDWAIKHQGQEQQQQQLQATCITSYGSSLLRTICHDAAQSKDGLFVLKYVYDFDYYLDRSSLLGSSFVDQLQIKQEQKKEQEKRRSIMRNDKELSVYAAKYGHVSILTWLHENGFDISFERAMYCASSQGHLDALQFLHANNNKITHHHKDPLNNKNKNNVLYSKLSTSTAMSKQLEVLKWLYNNNNNHSSTPTPTNDAVDKDDGSDDNLGVGIIRSDTAFFSEHLQVLEWLNSKGCAYIKNNCKQRAMDSDQMDDKEKAEMIQWIEMNM